MKNLDSRTPLVVLVASLTLATGCGATAPSASPAQVDRDPSSSGASADSASSSPSPAARSLPAGDPSPAPAATSSARPQGMPTRAADGNQLSVLRNLPGSTGPGCVDAGSARDVASGGFAAGPFDAARRGYRAAVLADRAVRLYFVPVHSSAMPGLQLDVTDRSGTSFTVTQKHWADADEFRFYDTQVTVPHRGVWQLRATAGADSGCWLVRI